jgi:glycosyltransferase involved in cell wall biosynthesis
LTGLIEKSGANVFLFPSIWPETFSYVVQELMSMSLPVASFNFGAPAERLETYQKGLVLDSMDPATVLDDLISFHRKSYLAN